MKTAMRAAKSVIIACMIAAILGGCQSGSERAANSPPDGLTALGTEVDLEGLVPERFRVAITPQAEAYEIPRDLGTVRNLDYYEELTEAQKRQLARVGFVVVPDNALQMFMLYEDYTDSEAAANFITVDSLLQAWHVFFGYALRSVESEHLTRLAAEMTELLLADAGEMLQQASEGPAEVAAHANLAYLAVALRLLDPSAATPEPVAALVEQELALIDAHASRAQSPIMGTTVHYTQFIPRGHYTRSEELSRYFRAMMWYGLLGFELETDDQEINRSHTLQALLLTRILRENLQARQAHARLNDPVEFFVGAADDLGYEQYLPIATSVFGEALPLEDLAAEGRVDEFIARARMELPTPGIAPLFHAADADGDYAAEPQVQGRQFRLLGQRFIPDSWVLQQLVSPLVGEPGLTTARDVPMGLDVMAALGSARAREILVEQYNQDRFTNYLTQLDTVTATLDATGEATWRSNLYWGWLYSLRPLLEPKGEGYPTFMHAEEWLDKQLNTSLASWAELRHDTILYAKQSGAQMGAFETAAPQGYVEPYPEVFARLAWLAWRSRDLLAERDLLPERLGDSLESFEETLLFLKSIAEKQLLNEPRTADEYRRLQYFGGELERLTLDVTEGGEYAGHWFEIENETDRNMAAIADVHTSFESALQVGVGPAYRIYVVVPHPGGDLQIARGGCFSYWEFLWPASDRLTDEKWQAMLAAGEAPEQPEWTGSFIVPGGEPRAR